MNVEKLDLFNPFEVHPRRAVKLCDCHNMVVKACLVLSMRNAHLPEWTNSKRVCRLLVKSDDA